MRSIILLSTCRAVSTTRRATTFTSTFTSASAVLRAKEASAVRNLNFSTYYDSQSGRDVPVNNEDEISIFFDYRNGGGSLEQIQEAGYRGVLWSPLPPTLATIEAALPSSMSVATANNNGFTLFVDSESTDLEQMQVLDLLDQHVNLVFEYMDNDDDDDDSTLQKRLEAHVGQQYGSTKTTIGLFDACYYQRDPILVASGVVTLMDKTGGGDFIWVQPPPPPTNNDNEAGKGKSGEEDDDDSIIDLCQQLSYLDVAGPTIKSRLIVTAQSEYQVEECLNIGVNKFVFQHDQHHEQHPNGVKWFSDVVGEQGKQIKLAVSRP
jgi:hypothetical protein